MTLSSGKHRDKQVIYQYLTVNGDGTGINSPVGNDYTSIPGIFFIAPSAGEVFAIHKLLFHMSDGGAFSRIGFGAGVVLPNGIQVRISDDEGVLFYIVEGIPLVNNDQFMHLSEAFQRESWSGGQDSILAEIHAEDFGIPIFELDGDQGHKLEVVFNDNFVARPSHFHVIAKGNK